jgi:XTP/dITP diphosphohydrolase
VRLVLATRNPGKRREFARLLPGHRVDPLPEDVVLPPETGDTFAANALVKARVAARATGQAAIADDSGIQADALGGAPGVRSARFAGEQASDGENLDRLRREAPAGSGLTYVCALAFVSADGDGQVLEGRCPGRMASTPAGDGGFGYDPVFLPLDGDGERTMAQLSDSEKDAISHRGQAARALLAWLAA